MFFSINFAGSIFPPSILLICLLSLLLGFKDFKNFIPSLTKFTGAFTEFTIVSCTVFNESFVTSMLSVTLFEVTFVADLNLLGNSIIFSTDSNILSLKSKSKSSFFFTLNFVRFIKLLITKLLQMINKQLNRSINDIISIINSMQ